MSYLQPGIDFKNEETEAQRERGHREYQWIDTFLNL